MRGGFFMPSLDGGLLLFELFLSSCRRRSATSWRKAAFSSSQNLNLAPQRVDQVANLGSQNHPYLDSCFPTPRPEKSYAPSAFSAKLLLMRLTPAWELLTAEVFTGKLAAAGVAISMDGRGRFMDNIFIERLWRSIKCEELHLKAYADGREARAGIGSWMTFYNFRHPHQAMNNQTPMAVRSGAGI